MGDVVPLLEAALMRCRFNPMTYLGIGWSVYRKERRDISQKLRELALTVAQFAAVLESGHAWISEDMWKCFEKTGCFRLDATTFRFLWENRQYMPQEWEKKTSVGWTPVVYFTETVLESPTDRHGVLFMCKISVWKRGIHWLDGFSPGNKSKFLFLSP